MTQAAPAVIDLAELVGDLRGRGARLALEGTVETTFRCNLACVHCYVNKPAQDPEERARELTTGRLLELVDEIAAAGCFTLLLTGGEVLCREDFATVYLRAFNAGLQVHVFTNGTMVTDRVAQLLAEHPPAMVEITLYGATRETYERVTRVPGSFDRCIAGIEKLLAHGVKVGLKTQLVTWNVHEFDAMVAIARRYGVGFREDGLLNARVDCGSNRNPELQVPAERLLAIDLRDPQRLKAMQRSWDDVRAAAAAPTDAPDQVFTCGAGEMGFNVDAHGQLQLCQLARGSGFDLREASFRQGWEEHFPRLRARTWQHNDTCRRCPMLRNCANCPGAAENALGDIEGVVAHFCELTHRRAFAGLGALAGHVADASCCFGRPGADAAPEPASACGGCSHGAAEPQPIRLTVRRPAAPPA